MITNLHWIPANVALPIDYKAVLLYTDIGKYYTGYYDCPHETWRFWPSGDSLEGWEPVTHWARLQE